MIFGQDYQRITANAVAAAVEESGRRGAGIVKFNEAIKDGTTAQYQALYVGAGNDAHILRHAMPWADEKLVLVTDLEGTSCDETLRFILAQLEAYKAIDKHAALMTWAAILRNLRFFVRTQQSPRGPHAAVFAASRTEEEDATDTNARKN